MCVNFEIFHNKFWFEAVIKYQYIPEKTATILGTKVSINRLHSYVSF
jgi:hypothetical protein